MVLFLQFFSLLEAINKNGGGSCPLQKNVGLFWQQMLTNVTNNIWSSLGIHLFETSIHPAVARTARQSTQVIYIRFLRKYQTYHSKKTSIFAGSDN